VFARPDPIRPPTARARTPVLSRVSALICAAVATLSLGDCGASHSGYIAVAFDSAGRLLAVIALCDGNRLDSLTLTDHDTGTSTTTHPEDTPDRGGSLILTPPIDNPRPEGALDLLERSHTYTLSGTVREGDADDADTSATSEVTFKLDTVVRMKSLRTGSVYAGPVGGDDITGAEIAKDDFLTQVADECG